MAEPLPPKQRRYPRAALHKGIAVAWKSGTLQGVARISMVGLGGLFIHEPNPPPVGAILQLLFQVAGGEVRARAAVRSAQAGEGMGVEFTNMRQEERARLAQLMKELLT
jgi:hypothetical protein